MFENPQINHPASFVTSTAVGFSDSLGNLAVVSAEAPLPVVQGRAIAPAPLTGRASGTIQIGPYTPLPDAPIHLQLTGVWAGTVAVLRSSDGGTTRLPLTAGGQPWARFTGNANEVVWQEGEKGATLYLDIALTSGSVAYRVSQ